MADYYPVLTRAISALESNTAEARRAVYERARQAIVKQLRSYDPPLSESEITKERLSLEEAVRRIEAEARAAAKAASEAPPVSVSPPKPPAPKPPATPVPPSAPSPAAASPAAAPPASAPVPDLPRPPVSPSPRVAGMEGLNKVHAAAAAAASLGAATASAQASVSSTRAAFDPSGRAVPPRAEPVIERPRVPGPLPAGRTEPPFGRPSAPGIGDAGPHPDEPDAGEAHEERGRKVGGLIAALVVVALAVGGYFARDSILPLLGLGGETTVSDAAGPKDSDRVGSGASEEPAPSGDQLATPDAAPQQETAPAVPAPQAPVQQVPVQPPADPAGLVAQRAILYDEAPDQQGGVIANGSVAWRTEPAPDNPAELRLVGQATIPDRSMTVTMTITRNLDQTLPASHIIEISFALPPDFPNVGIGNVPGILFKETEEAGGTALKGMSVKVTKNLFWIGLEASAADREQNMQAIRNRGWIDIPILYDNGRRAVLTIEKGTPGERAFEAAFAAWDTTPPAGAPARP